MVSLILVITFSHAEKLLEPPEPKCRSADLFQGRGWEGRAGRWLRGWGRGWVHVSPGSGFEGTTSIILTSGVNNC